MLEKYTPGFSGNMVTYDEILPDYAGYHYWYCVYHCNCFYHQKEPVSRLRKT